MNANRLIRIAAIVASVSACVAMTAFAGISLAAAAGGGSRHHQLAPRGPRCVRFDGDDTPQCLKWGPRGHRGRRGARGHRGPRGHVGRRGALGPIGVVGPQGATGPAGPQGAAGQSGIAGIQGPSGTFATGGSDPGGNLIEVLGTKIGPITFTSNVPGTGLELTPSTARCPTSGPDREAYDGGAKITTTSTSDVVGLESSFPGLYVGATEVDPLPLGSAPGVVSSESANAYEVQPVVTQMGSGDQVTYQAYVVCGP